VNGKSARTLLVAAVALYLVWLGSLIAMAVYSAKRPPLERIVRPLPASSLAEPENRDNR
jgi:hypothetical protein